MTPTGSWQRRIALALIVSGGAFAAITLLMLARGGPVELGPFRFSNPRPRLIGAFLGLTIGYVLLPGTKAPVRRKCAQLTLLLFSTGATLGLLEIGIRAFLQRTQGFNSLQQLYNPNPEGNLHTRSHHPLLVITRLSDNNRIIYELKPGVEMDFGHHELRISEQGLREDSVYPVRKPDHTLRIVGIGDSGMWGWNVHQGEEYLSVLEHNLKASTSSDTKVEVINFAVPGYNLLQELETLRHKALAFNPDIVVVGWCKNDYQLPFFMYTRRDHWGEKNSYVYRLLLDRTRFMEMVSPEVLKMGDIEKETVSPDVLEYWGWEGVKKGFAELHQLSEEHGFKLLIFGPIKEEPLKICDELGLNVYNTLEKIDPKDYPSSYAVHFMHPPKEGHAVLAEHLESHLRERGWLPTATRYQTGD